MEHELLARVRAGDGQERELHPGIAPGASVGIGFQATHTGNTGEPASFTLNGAACAVV